MRLAEPARWVKAGSAMRGAMTHAMTHAMTLAMACSTSLAAQRSVVVNNSGGDPLHEATPRFTISTSGFVVADLPLSIHLEVALSADFAAPLFADTTVSGSSATIVIPRLLPPSSNVWWRAVARTAQGALVGSLTDGPRRTSPWLTLITPNNLNGSTVDANRPQFVWSSPAIFSPVAPWRYTVAISRSSDGFVVQSGTLADTVFNAFADLESNTSYRWAVSAVAGTGDSLRIISASSFVIASANAPIATVLFQNFPNPFPNDRLNATCIWFDLRRQSDISLEVLDLRGNHVAKILPGRGLGGTLPPGRYGRAVINSDSGCDERLSWNGTDDAGRIVRPGVYLIKFTGDGVTQIRKALFLGR